MIRASFVLVAFLCAAEVSSISPVWDELRVVSPWFYSLSVCIFPCTIFLECSAFFHFLFVGLLSVEYAHQQCPTPQSLYLCTFRPGLHTTVSPLIFKRLYQTVGRKTLPAEVVRTGTPTLLCTRKGRRERCSYTSQVMVKSPVFKSRYPRITASLPHF
jgi:hypothetical protein